MTSNPLKPNVQDLQTDVIELLGQISTLMYRASTALSSDRDSKKYTDFKKEVDDANRNVDKLELRMAIVAPMKAGKSTIINAIVGQDILPSRNAAMTTLPTEIVFNADLLKPTLTLSTEISSVFQKTFIALQNKIRELDPLRLREKMEQYPHLMELSGQIEAGDCGFLANAAFSGREEIIKALTGLNDIVRLCSLIAPSSDPLGQLTDVPCIETPFWRTQKTEKSEKLGNLIIIDTPGPNEAGEHLKLKGVVEEQLCQSSIVLIVLDFTQLKNKAAEEVKQDVQKVINLRGKENLYVLINKVDQRRDGDMIPEQVRQFVAAEFGIGDISDTDRVFEIAARRAFVAANFMQELEQNPNVLPKQMQTGRSLAQEVLGIDWEEELEDVTIGDLEKKAQSLWKKSGFDPFLEKAIKALIERAAPQCMNSALKLSRNRLVELQDDVKFRSSAIAQDAEKLHREVGALEADLNGLEDCRILRLKEVDMIKVELHRNLEQLVQVLKETAKVRIEDYFVEENYERGNLFQKLDIKFRDLLLTELSGIEFFPKLSRGLKSKLEFKPSKVFEFNSEREAEEFANQAVAYAKDKAESLLSGVRKQTEVEVEKTRKSLTTFLEKETQPIIERARKRLNEAFNVNLSLPQPKLESDEMELVKPRVKSDHRYVDQGYGERTVKKRKFTHWFWLVPVDVKEPYKKEDKRVNYYTVYLGELIEQINQSIDKSINSINKGINNYLDENFQQQVDDFFKELEDYLGNYRDNLKQAQNDQRLSLKEKEKLVSELSSLVPEATRYVEKADNYLTYTRELMNKTK